MSQMNHSMMINERIVKPLELILNSDTDTDDATGTLKDPLEIFQHRTNESEKPETYKSRKINQEDGLIYFLSNKPGKIEFRDMDTKIEHKLRMLICVTMYNEEKELLIKTLEGIYDNLEYFLMHGICAEDIAVCVISDGILKMDNSVRLFHQDLDKEMKNPPLTIESKLKDIEKGCQIYIDQAKNNPREYEKRKKEVEGKNHIPSNVAKKTAICYQTRLSCKDFPETEMIKTDYQNEKLNVFFTVKIMNKQKLSSHLWFFQGFCKTFNPQYCVVLDCGTKPEKKGVWNFFRALEADRNVGGVCGYMGARTEDEFTKVKPLPFTFKIDPADNIINQWYLKAFNCFLIIVNLFITGIENIFSIQKAQEFEYAFAHIFDKAFESFFGFISVLPGAWSAYRWDALSEDNLLEKEYFKTVLEPDYVYKSIREANKILAEDRLLCLAIFTKRNRSYTLKYVPDAGAKTDLVDTVPKLLAQRKRWINGTWYALEYVIDYQNQIRFSKHSNTMKLMFSFSMFMAKVGMYIIYFMMCSFLITLYILVFAYFGTTGTIDQKEASLAGFFVFLFISLMSTLVFLSLQFTSNDKAVEFFFRIISHLLGIFSLFTFGLMMVLLFQELFQDATGYFADQSMLRIFMIINASCYVVVCLVNPTPLKTILRCLPHYLYYTPTYLHIMVVYAFCRIDDLSWGTKGAHAVDQTNKSKEYKEFKVNFVASWLLSNAAISYVVIVIISSETNQSIFLTFLIAFITLLVSLKSVFAFLNQVQFLCFDSKNYYHTLKVNAEGYKKQSEKIKKYYKKIQETGGFEEVNKGHEIFNREESSNLDPITKNPFTTSFNSLIFSKRI